MQFVICKKLIALYCILYYIVAFPVHFPSHAKNLSVTHSNNLSMEKRVTNICKSAFVEIRRISNIHYYLITDTKKKHLVCAFVLSKLDYLTTDTTKTLVCAFVLSKLDYCNSVLSGCPNQFLTNCNRSKILQQDSSSKLTSKNLSNPFFENSTGYQSTQESTTKSQPCATVLSLKLTHSICLNF